MRCLLFLTSSSCILTPLGGSAGNERDDQDNGLVDAGSDGLTRQDVTQLASELSFQSNGPLFGMATEIDAFIDSDPNYSHPLVVACLEQTLLDNNPQCQESMQACQAANDLAIAMGNPIQPCVFESCNLARWSLSMGDALSGLPWSQTLDYELSLFAIESWELAGGTAESLRETFANELNAIWQRDGYLVFCG